MQIVFKMTTCIIVDKTGTLKTTSIKEYDETLLYKKCGFKKPDGFIRETEWMMKLNKQSYVVRLYGKTTGRANTENKYDFPPPADNTLFFSSCLLIAFHKDKNEPCDLDIELWEKMYEKLFGGFEDLSATQKEDDNEVDELENIPDKYKTKSGYLKDGFIVSDSDENEDIASYSESEELNTESVNQSTEDDDEILLDEVSELCEEEYEYHEA